MTGGYVGRIGFVDLTTGDAKEERLDEDVARSFIGGYGLGVRVMFERQKAGCDALGPENILGFVTGPLTGTAVPTGGRYAVVCKSPLTGGIGDANSGGYFGSRLKSAGWDAIFVSGVASSPKYAVVTKERIELKDASHIWGKDTSETEEILRTELGARKVEIACIGPASERLSLISGIVTDKGRIAARSGVGAVMGSKRLKAVATYGDKKVNIADKTKLDLLRSAFLGEMRNPQGFAKGLSTFGTCDATAALVAAGATPVKNWREAGEPAFPTVRRIGGGNEIVKYQTKRYGCANCPIACGGILSVSEGPYPVQEMHKPEYETMGALGAMCLNDDLFSILKMNDMCNRSGLDTISAGAVIAFAMECYEKGIITKDDTEGIDLTWGNGAAMIEILTKMISRDGIGDILADGVRVASQRIGKGAEHCAVEVGGQEPGMHNPLFLPSRGTGFLCDPTPGRHTTSPMTRIESGAPIAPYKELRFIDIARYEYKEKGVPTARASCYWQIGTCAGLCMFPTVMFGNFPTLDYLNAVTGWDITVEEALETGRRIQTLRQVFNIREGLKPAEMKLHDRMVGVPAMATGPLAGITIDIDTLSRDFREAMGWDRDTAFPTKETLRTLGLLSLIGDAALDGVDTV